MCMLIAHTQIINMDIFSTAALFLDDSGFSITIPNWSYFCSMQSDTEYIQMIIAA